MNAKQAIQALADLIQQQTEVLKSLTKRIDALEADNALDFDLETPAWDDHEAHLEARREFRKATAQAIGNADRFPEDWGTMTEDQQAAWVRAHTGLTMPVEKEAEWQTVELADGLGAEFPVPPDEIRTRWEEAAPSIFENWKPDPTKGVLINKGAAAEAYIKAGPLWLAAYAHDFLMGLPYEWRQEMAAEVTSYAQSAGRDLQRDILRHGTEDAKGFAYDLALSHADNRPSAHR